MTFNIRDSLITNEVRRINEINSKAGTNVGVDKSIQGSRQKRKREELIGQQARVRFSDEVEIIENSNEESLKRRKISSAKARGKLEPILEIPRDDAFVLGLQAANKYQMNLLEQYAEENEEEIEKFYASEKKNEYLVPLKRYQEGEIESIVDTIDKKIGSQFFELYQILERKKLTKTENGKAILKYANEVIRNLPKKETIVEENVDEIEISQEYLEMAEKCIDKFPVAIPKDHIRKLAFSLQKSVENAPEDLEDDDINEESNGRSERDEQIDLASVKLGNLLLLAKGDYKVVLEAINTDTIEEADDNISNHVQKIYGEALDRIEKHKKLFQHTSIQSSEEAGYQQLSRELAEILLTDTGNINFGVIEDAANAVVPEYLKNTVANDNLWTFLSELTDNPTLWKAISETCPPKSNDIPTALAIRCFFGLDNKVVITKRHAQLFVLSALLGHLRQSKTGTCFATACLIKGLFHHPDFFIKDLADLTENGYVDRLLFQEKRSFPMQERISKEYLDVEMRVNREGKIYGTRRYDLIDENQHTWNQPDLDAYIYESPGIVAACKAIGIKDVKEAVLIVIANMKDHFPAFELLKQLANYSFTQQELKAHWMRSEKKLTIEELNSKALFAYGIQTNHPLHRGYEQVCTSIVDYFGAQYTMPSWMYMTLEKVLKKSAHGFPISFQHKYKSLLKEIFLPMICRMRYRYNPNFDKAKILFEEGNYGIRESHWYGYQLCDTGLPKDFEYNTSLYEDYHNERSFINLIRFEEYSEPTDWKLVETEEKFRNFVLDVIKETSIHLENKASSATERNEWLEVSKKMHDDVSKPTFTRNMVCRMFGAGNEQKKALLKDEFNLKSTPWQFAWGGDFNEVLKTYFNFGDDPSKLKDFNGTPKEVLAKCINYIKQQPDTFKEEFDNPKNQIIVSSPVHVFLLRPFEPTFKEAWESEINTNTYITQNVEIPGLEISNSFLNNRQKEELISFVAHNGWVIRYFEREDWVRQQLTDESKKIFDEKLLKMNHLSELTVEEFKKTIVEIVKDSRAADPKIGTHNTTWEASFKKIFNNVVKKLVPNETDRNKVISDVVAKMLLDYARNRNDTVGLSDNAVIQFQELMRDVPAKSTIKEFRTALVANAYKARTEDVCHKDPEWKEKFCEQLDTKIFNILTKTNQKKLINSGIVTHDTNWKESVHDIHFIFIVNPGTGKIELADFIPDTQRIRFMGQSDWFPRKLKGHGYWQFPDNYRAWMSGPLFNVKKLMSWA